MSIPCVQADHDSCGCDTDHPVPENHLLQAIDGDEAGCFRLQEADRLFGMGDLARYRLRDRLLGRKIDILPVELTPGQCHKAAIMRTDVSITLCRGSRSRRLGTHTSVQREKCWISRIRF